MKKLENLFQRKNLLLTLGIIVLIAAATLVAVFRINIVEEQNCYTTLFQTGDQLNQDIARLINYDKEQLESLAGIFAEYDNLNDEIVLSIISNYKPCGMVSGLEILLPDNTLIVRDGTMTSVEGSMDFAKEAKKGAYLTEVGTDILDSDKRVLYSVVPIVKDGEVTGILRGVINPDELQDVWNINLYGARADIYIVEKSSGNYVVDTSGNKLGNVKFIDNMRIIKRSSMAEISRHLMRGGKGYAVFDMPDSSENLYFCYMPCEVNNWELAISVPESAVYKNGREVRILLFLLVGFECLCFIVYLMWMFHDARVRNYEKQRRIELMSFTGRVQELLFEAHQNQNNIELALELIGEMTDSQYVFFKILGENGTEEVYQWIKDDPGQPMLRVPKERVHFFMHYFYFKDGSGSIFMPNIEELKVVAPTSYDLLVDKGVTSLMAVPVNDVSGRLVGVLGTCNMGPDCKDTHILEAVKLSFSMLYHNIRSYNIIREMGTVDLLTGLLNRNCYQKNLLDYPNMQFESLACVYCDVNGLHELNNSQGHEAGDEMLREVALTIRNYFGDTHSYRIGGDEFVAFVLDADMENVAKQSEAIAKKLQASDYYVSIGISIGRPRNLDQMEELVKKAETEMYEAKRIFYENGGRERRRR